MRCRFGRAVDTVDGLPAVLTIHITYGSDVLVVPELAIRYREGDAPYLLDRGGARHEVQLGPSNGILRAIVRGIDEGVEVQVPSPIDRPAG